MTAYYLYHPESDCYFTTTNEGDAQKAMNQGCAPLTAFEYFNRKGAQKHYAEVPYYPKNRQS